MGLDRAHTIKELSVQIILPQEHVGNGRREEGWERGREGGMDFKKNSKEGKWMCSCLAAQQMSVVMYEGRISCRSLLPKSGK